MAADCYTYLTVALRSACCCCLINVKTTTIAECGPAVCVGRGQIIEQRKSVHKTERSETELLL